MRKYLIYILLTLLCFTTKANIFLYDDVESVHVDLSEKKLSDDTRNSLFDQNTDDIEECEDEESLKYFVGCFSKIYVTNNEKKSKITFLKINSVFNYSLINICIDLPPPSKI